MTKYVLYYQMFSEQMGASRQGVRRIKEVRTEAVRTPLRRFHGCRRPPDHQVRRDLHLPQDLRCSQGKAPGPLRVHADGLHPGKGLDFRFRSKLAHLSKYNNFSVFIKCASLVRNRALKSDV
jgi:hypothetical protein